MLRRYPYEHLPRFSSRALALVRSLRAHVGTGAGGAVARWAQDCLGVDTFSVELLATAKEVDPVLASRLDATARFELDGDDGALSLALDAGLVSDLARRIARVPGAAGGVGSTPGEWGLVAHGLAWLLATLPTGSRWRVRPTTSRGEVDRRSQVLTFRFVAGELGGVVWLFAEPGTELALTPSPQVRRRGLPSWLATFPVAFSVQLARISLPLVEVGLLAPGDIVIASGLPREVQGRVLWISAGSGGFVGRVQDEGILIEEWRRGPPPEVLGALPRDPRDAKEHEGIQKGEVSMSGERVTPEKRVGFDEGDARSDPALADERAGFVEALEVEVSVELARITLSAGELSTLRAGDIVRLDRPLVAPLDLWVGKRRMGRAELIDVDGEAGLRVVEVYD